MPPLQNGGRENYCNTGSGNRYIALRCSADSDKSDDDRFAHTEKRANKDMLSCMVLTALPAH